MADPMWNPALASRVLAFPTQPRTAFPGVLAGRELPPRTVAAAPQEEGGKESGQVLHVQVGLEGHSKGSWGHVPGRRPVRIHGQLREDTVNPHASR